MTGNYVSSFYFAGVVSICGGALMIFIPLKIILAKWYDNVWNIINPPDELPFKKGQESVCDKQFGSHSGGGLKKGQENLSYDDLKATEEDDSNVRLVLNSDSPEHRGQVQESTRL